MKKIFITIVFLNSFIAYLSAQTVSEIESFSGVFDKNHVKENHVSALKNNSNEIQFVFSGLFVIYKQFISSQDISSCVFHPSCSVYAITSIKKQGLFIGFLSSFDRLMRCNAFSSANYPHFENSQFLYDPVQ